MGSFHQRIEVLMTISHFTGCLWFAIGARDTSDSTWVQVGGYTTQGRKWDDEMEKIGRPSG